VKNKKFLLDLKFLRCMINLPVFPKISPCSSPFVLINEVMTNGLQQKPTWLKLSFKHTVNILRDVMQREKVILVGLQGI